MNYTRKEQGLPSRIGWRNLVTEITLQKSQKGEQMSEKSFIDKCLDGEAFLSELDDYIDYLDAYDEGYIDIDDRVMIILCDDDDETALIIFIE